MQGCNKSGPLIPPAPVVLNLLLMLDEHVLRRDLADCAVQTDVIVMVYVTFSASFASQRVCSVILTEERFLHFQLRQDTVRIQTLVKLKYGSPSLRFS